MVVDIEAGIAEDMAAGIVVGTAAEYLVDKAAEDTFVVFEDIEAAQILDFDQIDLAALNAVVLFVVAALIETADLDFAVDQTF